MSRFRSTVIQGYFPAGRFVVQRQASRPNAASGARATGQPARGPSTGIQASGLTQAAPLDSGQLNLARSMGHPLPEPVQRKMESFFNTNFADVRVHVGPQAQSIGALAFTMGSDIYFAPGQYHPNTPHGQQLLGHELTHVVQQRAGRVRNPFGSGLAVVQDHALEAEADRLGRQAAIQPYIPPGRK